jgi:phenylacetic acid degradation operon negative regulatory protein
MRPAGARAWTQTLITALGLVGVEDKAARQAISRLSAKGWITSERVGRKSRWQLTDGATDLLTRGAERIYGLGADRRHGTGAWNGEWLVLLASVPESQRQLRSRLAVQLGWAGFGTLGPGVWLSPRVEREAEATSILVRLEVDGAVLFRSTMTDVGNPLDVAARAWPPGVLAHDYETFLAHLDDHNCTDPSTADRSTAARQLIELVDAWRRFPLVDPDLPVELRPADWPGDRAADAFAELRASWAPAAAAWWSATDGSFD